jgi:hypothetical protein
VRALMAVRVVDDPVSWGLGARAVLGRYYLVSFLGRVRRRGRAVWRAWVFRRTELKGRPSPMTRRR